MTPNAIKVTTKTKHCQMLVYIHTVSNIATQRCLGILSPAQKLRVRPMLSSASSDPSVVQGLF